MTFNIWRDGTQVENGLAKIVKHIKFINPDIVAIQELKKPETLKNITNLLGPDWTGIYNTINATYPDNAIITKHQILDNTVSKVVKGIGTDIQLNTGHVISFWGLHLYQLSYGPYAAQNKLVTKHEQIMKGEMMDGMFNGDIWIGSRVQNIEELLSNENFQKSIQNADQKPVILAGDFNCPSHLDWTEETKDKHGGWVFEWPVTKLLTEKVNLIDSYRHIYPDPAKDPGETWSCVQKSSGPEWSYTIPEPQDRIDFIFYKSHKLVPVHSFTYSGTEPLAQLPNAYQNDFPSDHHAVVTDFRLVIEEFARL
uniref:Endonuclease/exonuclease/phosphatase domain-containing protein n=1 Tax=Acrobeloides nanus TaxID=290746 RepID=A0A914CM45_9BILA